MAFIQYLNFNGENLPLPMTYDMEFTDVEADTSGDTEAGTRQRDVLRSGVVSISVSFQVSPTWLKKLSVYQKEAKIKVSYFDTTELDIKETDMFMEGFKSSLVKDTSYKGLWKVSFTLQEF